MYGKSKYEYCTEESQSGFPLTCVCNIMFNNRLEKIQLLGKTRQ